jgi:hypothetical protein
MAANTGINPLLDVLVSANKLKNDAALAKILGVDAPVISNLRHVRLPLRSTMILRIHERLAMPVAEIRRLIAS